MARVESVKPKVHAFGHIHESYGWYYNEYTIFVNASICNESYAPVNKPYVIEHENGDFLLPIAKADDGSSMSLKA
jgi:Icc-related predicted phosphoesterase